MSIPPFLRPIIACVLRSFVKSTKEEYQRSDKEVPERPKDKSYLSSLFCDNALLSQHIRIALQGFGLLTGSRVRDITSPSWHPSSAENGYGAKLPENPTHIIYQSIRAC